MKLATFFASLKSQNSFAHSALVAHLKSNNENLWFDYIFENKLDDETLAVSQAWLQAQDPELAIRVQDQLNTAIMTQEENQRYMADETTELEDWQDVEALLDSYDESVDKLEMYLNEY